MPHIIRHGIRSAQSPLRPQIQNLDTFFRLPRERDAALAALSRLFAGSPGALYDCRRQCRSLFDKPDVRGLPAVFTLRLRLLEGATLPKALRLPEGLPGSARVAILYVAQDYLWFSGHTFGPFIIRKVRESIGVVVASA